MNHDFMDEPERKRHCSIRPNNYNYILFLFWPSNSVLILSLLISFFDRTIRLFGTLNLNQFSLKANKIRYLYYLTTINDIENNMLNAENFNIL